MQIHIENFHVNTAPAGDDIATLLKRIASAPLAGPPSSVPRIGQPWPGEGGTYAGLIRCDDGDYHLIVATDPSGQNDSVTWGAYGTDEPGAVSDTNGPANTSALANGPNSHPAAEWADGVDIDAFEDWYLPSRRELCLCWVNVPELFKDGWYWTSTQCSAHLAWSQYFGDGSQDTTDKDDELRARAVRRFKAE